MHAPFRRPHASGREPLPASFHAVATRVGLGGGVTFGRSMAGFTGVGTIEVVPAGVRIVARRYRYRTNLAVALVVGLATAIAFGMLVAAGKSDPEAIRIVHKSGVFWGVVAGILAFSIATAMTRVVAPETVVVDRIRITHAQLIGPRLRIFASDGDVELWIAEREGMQALVSDLAALGVPLR